MTGLAGLSGLREQLRDEARQRALEAQRARLERERLEREQNLFRSAVSDAVPLARVDRVEPVPVPPPPVARQFQRDEQLALAASLSDEIDIERLLDTDEALSYRRPEVGADIPRRLRRGEWVTQGQLDLHGLRVDAAREALVGYLADCLHRGRRCVRVIHGKGLGSVNREPVLKGKVLRWLTQREEVLAFCQAGPHDGGSGAVLVLLRSARPRTGRA